MKILIIEEETFNEMLKRFENFAKRVETLCELHKEKGMAEWLNTNDVCTILNIKPRTLQTYRDTGKIGFSQITRKIFYSNSDVQKILEDNKFNSDNFLKEKQ